MVKYEPQHKNKRRSKVVTINLYETPGYSPSKPVQHILAKLKESYEWADNSFAHIVIGDWNLEDYHIDWCLEPEQVFHWIREELKTKHKNYCDPTSSEDWKRCEFEDVLKEAQAIIEALNEIKKIPEDDRYFSEPVQQSDSK